MHRCLNTLALGFLLALVSACSKKDTITIAGSSTVLPIISVAAEQFSAQHPDVNVVVNAGGSGLGINQLGEGLIDIGMSSRDITEAERKRHASVNFVSQSVGKDAVVPAVSADIYHAGVRSLSIEQLAQIYRGEIDNWKMLGGPDRKILCIDKERSRGTRHVFMKIVLGDAEADARGADLVLGSNNEEQTAIAQSDAAIGMLSLAWLNDRVKAVALTEGNGETVVANEKNIKSQRYPFTRDLHIIFNGEPKDRLSDFHQFLLSDAGQALVSKAGYVPIH